MRSPSIVEVAALIAVGGSVLAVMLPTFVENLHASRLTEPLDTLNRLATRATALAAGRPAEAAYPESTGLTPSQVPRGELVTDPPGTWEHPTWKRLGIAFDVPHAFSFEFDSHNAAGAGGEGDAGAAPSAGAIAPTAAPLPGVAPAPAGSAGGETDRATFRAVAHGDLDGDGSLSTFEIRGESRDGSEPVVSALTMSREVE
jgi:hypothetical protein